MFNGIRPMYEVLNVNEDGNTGDVVGYSYDEEVASALAEGKGSYDSNGKVTEVNVVMVDDKLMVLRDTNEITDEMVFDEQFIIDRAVAKLSTVELRVLGLNKEEDSPQSHQLDTPVESSETPPDY